MAKTRGAIMETVIYYLRNDAPLYMDTYFAESCVRAFKKLGIKSYVFPKFLQKQAI